MNIKEEIVDSDITLIHISKSLFDLKAKKKLKSWKTYCL
jgi:hypothetical protein